MRNNFERKVVITDASDATAWCLTGQLKKNRTESQ
jgi:hypothetical protein